ncbi:uncharacterized protein LOC133195886 [Saccostrea echinata]|uniref:uncharacterized protein LOC133195886 n=1 Tax=Saccostrea echinata TaxID=191078 RepID=UPI002A830650|nr:uncharacterized protein LOC133195886 [Saccostrea echinata]
MDKKQILLLTLVTVFITFGLWLSSIVTRGWFVLTVKTTSIQPTSILKNILSLNSLLNLNNIISSKRISLPPVRVELSIFYCTLCTAGNCLRVPFDKLPSAISAVVENLPRLLELQITSTVALSLCVIGFFLLMLNFGSTSKVMVGGITILVAALSELFLILRMVIATVQVALDSVESTLSLLNLNVIEVEVHTPYSIILAGIGLVFIILGMVSSRILYSKLRESSTDGRMMNSVSSIPPINLTIHRERY